MRKLHCMWEQTTRRSREWRWRYCWSIRRRIFSEQTEVREASDRELEARAIAARIKQLVGAHPVFDKKSGAYRPAKYSDIVILTRSLKGWTDVFTEVLNREGIPTFTGSKEGYFETREIRLLLDYLRVLDNTAAGSSACSCVKINVCRTVQ